MASSRLIDIDPFDFNTLPENGFFVAIAKRDRGKTILLREFTQRWRHAKKGIVMLLAGAEKVKAQWSEIIHPLFIHDPSTDVLKRILDNQRKVVKRYANKPFPDKYKILLLFDDCGANKKLLRSQTFLHYASIARQEEITCAIAVQYIYQLPSEVRTNIDIIFAQKTQNKKNIGTLADEFAAGLELSVFQRILIYMTRSFGTLVIDTRGDSDVPQSCLFHFRAPYPPSNNHVGNPDLWTFAESHYLDMNKMQPTPSESKDSALSTFVSRLMQEEDINGDDDEFDEIMDSEESMKHLVSGQGFDILNNRQVFEDKFGKLIIRKTPTTKRKVD